MTQYNIPCKHETGEASHNETVSDYHPLTQPEIADLLYTAKSAKEQVEDPTQTIASIQCRLEQGIVGIVCPHEIEGVIARRLYQLDKLFVDYIQGNLPEYSDQEVIDELYTLMQG